MPKIIVTSRFIRAGNHSKLNNYVKYIATREGVELTKNAQLIPELDREIFINYLGTRPDVVKQGAHGLFSDTDKPIILDKAGKEVAQHNGTVWTHIVSLKREDAERMGYNTLDMWRDLVRRHIVDIADAQKISVQNIRWYAAFHNKESNPHVHIVIYSVDQKEGYLTNAGIEKIRSAFANDIYRDELQNLYQQQTKVRNGIRNDAEQLMYSLVEDLKNSDEVNPVLQDLIIKLSAQLRRTKGKKVYGYLQPVVKKNVDQIVAEIAKTPALQKMYELWCNLEKQKYSTYTSVVPSFPPIHENKVFKPIKNHVIDIVSNMTFALTSPECAEQEQDNISESDIEINTDISDTESQADASSGDCYFINWTSEYKSSCHELYNNKDIERALVLLQKEADKGNVLAMHDVGMIYNRGLVEDENAKALADEYYRKAYNGFLSLEGKGGRLLPYIQYRLGKMLNAGKGTEKDFEKAFAYFEKSAISGNKYAQYSLGSMYRLGTGVEQSYENAYLWYEKSAQQENPYACYETAKLLRDGKGVEKNLADSDRFFRSAYSGFQKFVSDVADDKLLYRMGSMTMNGIGCEKDIQKAISYYTRAAELKNDNALYELGKLLVEGKVIFQDIEKGIDMLTSAAETNQNARCYLAKMYLSGEIVEQDIEKAIAMLETCTDNPYAMYMLGKIYTDSKYVAPIYSKAENYFKLAAEKGLDCAEYTLGNLYLSDRYKHIPLAEKYLSSAVEHGNSYAMYALAKLYLGGELPKNVEKVFELLTKAYESGNSMGAYALGKLYLYGCEVKRDIDTARYWFTQATNMGNEYASAMLQNLDRHNNSAVNNAVLSMLFSFGRLISDDYERKSRTRFVSERKLKDAIRRKKEALGLKDDHTVEQQY